MPSVCCMFHQVSPLKVPTLCPQTVCKRFLCFGNDVWFGILGPDERQWVHGLLGKSFYEEVTMRTHITGR